MGWFGNTFRREQSLFFFFSDEEERSSLFGQTEVDGTEVDGTDRPAESRIQNL